MLVIPLVVFCLQNLLFASSQDILHMCNDVIKPRIDPDIQENCTLVCGLYIHHYVLPQGIQEIALCVKDEFTPLPCERDTDCHRFHHASYCKKVQCLCEGSERRHRFLPKQQSDFLEICVAPSNWLHTNVPLVTFPWKTVLAVFGVLGFLVIIFMGFRWLYPILRTFHTSDSRHTSNEHCASSDENIASPLYPHDPQYGLSDRSVPYGNAEDKPPPYETLAQLLDLPPSYEETASISSNLPNEENQNQRREVYSASMQQPIESGTEATNAIVK